MEINAVATPNSAEPFRLRTEGRPHPYCNVCAKGDGGALDPPKLNLPRLRGSCALVTTKLSESISRSTVGHVFDLSIPMENPAPPKYNCLHDPHLKSFFSRGYMRNRLLANGYITPSGNVLCSLKEYNAYYNFLESEFSKVRRLQEESEESLMGCNPQKCKHEMMACRHVEERKALVQKQQQVWHTREMQHVVKREAIVGRRERKELADMKLQADRRMKKDGQKDGGVGSVLEAELVAKEPVMLVATEGQPIPDQEDAGGTENPRLLQRKRILHLLKKFHEERQLVDSSHTRAQALKAEADKIQKHSMETKAQQLNQWRVHFAKLQKRWRTLVDNVVQPAAAPDPPQQGQPLTPNLSAKNSLIHHHTRMSSRDPRRKVSVPNPTKPTQCVRFNMEPEVRTFSKETGGHGDDSVDDGLGTGAAVGSSVQDDEVIVRDLEPVGVAV